MSSGYNGGGYDGNAMMPPTAVMGGGGGSGGDGGVSAGGQQSPQQAYRLAANITANLQQDLQIYEQQYNKLLEDVQMLTGELSVMHRQFEELQGEKQFMTATADRAEERLRNARAICSRYTVVQDPVVASDGYTYESEVIKDYFRTSKLDNCPALSNQTNEPLTSLLIPNRSLKTLLTLLEEHFSEPTPSVTAGTAVSTGNHHSSANNASAKASSNTSSNHTRNIYSSNTTTTNYGGGGGRNFGGNSRNANNGGFGYGNSSSNTNNINSSHDHHHGAKDASGTGGVVELNALGERVHPCIRVYGFCNYKDVCAYAQYPYDACLSNLKGKCRFKNQCHERHVEFKGPLNTYGQPISGSGQRQSSISHHNNNKNQHPQHPQHPQHHDDEEPRGEKEKGTSPKEMAAAEAAGTPVAAAAGATGATGASKKNWDE